MAESGKIDAVVATKRDRLFRNQLYRLTADKDLQEYGVRLVALNDTGNRIGDSVLDSYAEWERETFIDRSRAGKRERARSGKVIPAGERSLPYGFQYNTDRTNYVPDPVTMPVVHRIFEMISTGSSLHAIKTTLDREGVPTPRGKGPWNKITIRRYLLSDLYKSHTTEELHTLGVSADVLDRLDAEKQYGVWWFGVDRAARTDEPKKRRDGQQRSNASSKPRRYKKQDDAIPVPIADAGIPREWVDAARRYFETYRGWKLTREGKPVEGRRYYELRGYVYCGACGRKYTGYQNSSRAYFYYGCQARRNHGTKACPHSHNYNADKLEKIIMRDVEMLLQDPERVKSNLDEAIARETASLRNPGSESATWLGIVEDCDCKRSGYLDLAADGIMGRDELTEKLRNLEATKSAAESKLQESRAGESRLNQLQATRRAILASYADGILYDGIRWLTPELRHEIYDALGLRVTVGTDGTLTIDYHVDANVIKFSRAVEEYAREEMDSPGRIYSSRAETDTSIVVMK
jgi:DNA invertase Pin-like site-specific DNA recombinase